MDRPHGASGRRQFVRGLGGLALGTVLAGCSGPKTMSKEANYVGIPPEKREEIGVTLADRGPLTVERTGGNKGLTVTAFLTAYLAQYTDERTTGLVTFFSTPRALFMNEAEVNPAMKQSVPDYIENRPGMFARISGVPLPREDPVVERVGDASGKQVRDGVDAYLAGVNYDEIDLGQKGYRTLVGYKFGPADLTGVFVPAVEDGRLNAYYAVVTRIHDPVAFDAVIAVYAGWRTVVDDYEGGETSLADRELVLVASDAESGLFTPERIRTYHDRFVTAVTSARASREMPETESTGA